MKLNERICQAGATMMEVLGVLAIMAIITTGALAGYGAIMQRYTESKGTTGMKEIFKEVHNFCSFDRPCRITTEKAYKMGILTDMTYANSQGLSPYGSDFKFTINNGQDAGGTFVCPGCYYYALSQKPMVPVFCERLLTEDFDETVYGRLYALKANGQTFISNTNNYQGTCLEENGCFVLPVDLGKAVEMCEAMWANRDTEDGSANMTWYFI